MSYGSEFSVSVHPQAASTAREARTYTPGTRRRVSSSAVSTPHMSGARRSSGGHAWPSSGAFRRCAPPDRAGGPRQAARFAHTRPHTWHTGRMPACLTGGRWWGIEGGGGKVHESRGGDISRGRPVGGRSDRAGLPGCADAWRPPAALGGVARSRGRSPHSRPAPASRTHRGETPRGTPPRGTAPCATARLGRSRRPVATAAQGEGTTCCEGRDRPNGGGGRRRASRWTAITRTRLQPPA